MMYNSNDPRPLGDMSTGCYVEFDIRETYTIPKIGDNALDKDLWTRLKESVDKFYEETEE